MRPWEAILGSVIVLVGAWLRARHLGTPSLWWDELVQIRTAELPTVLDVARTAWLGVVPGGGNAGAVPLDYLLLHAWVGTVPPPRPDAIETYYRLPAFLAASATPAAFWLLLRRQLGRVAAIVGAAVLAASVYDVLYAAEVRFYAALVLATTIELAVFARLAAAPERGRRWLGFTVAAACLVMTGLYGGFVVAAQMVALGVLSLERWRRGERRPLLLLVATGAPLAVLGGLYLRGAGATLRYGRQAVVGLGPLMQIPATLAAFAGGARWQGWVLLAAFPAALAHALLRDRRRVPLVAVCTACLLAVPVIVLIAQWKDYYYHPRHAIFLLPLVAVAVGVVASAVLEPVCGGRRALAAIAGVGLVALATTQTLAAYVSNPEPFFAHTKTERDHAGLVRALVPRVAALSPDERLLVLVERNRPGHLANPVLAFYLRAYGIEQRVMLRGFDDPLRALEQVRRRCPDGCRGVAPAQLAGALAIGDPYDLKPPVRRLLRLPDASAMAKGRIGGTVVVVYARTGEREQPGFTRTGFRGLALLVPVAALAPPPPAG